MSLVPCQDPDHSVLIENEVSPARKRLRQAFDAVAVAPNYPDFLELGFCLQGT